ncbi:endo-1,4-beta-xylanase [Rhodohalobacter sp. SW132]|uniref:endo-1,4-beta-xylanase n=1 Tax=Rhodohalobacter sp. SW132 TaxID=2293433 RepID=UPI000E239B2F|nr:endo-1,4-beta-xylanase [Rhodohalobacter sp. SW132]REL38119.1 endo-1,4-beta-xylanase [Rhodohalobacter sp. SW132]
MKSILFTSILLLLIGCGSDRDQYQQEQTEEQTLRSAFEGSFLIGTILNHRQIFGQDQRGQDLAVREFNAVTAENVMKWENIHPEPGVYDFDAADTMIDIAEENGMFVVGHTLVWHSQTPDWVFYDDEGELLSREALLERMKDHIETVVGRYKGRVHGWDVVNEAIVDDGTMRDTYWYRIIGEDFLVKAFEYAHAVDPEAELYYNDYSLEIPSKREGAIRLVEYLQENDAPITGIGTQGHFMLDFPDLEEIEKTITDFAALGIDVMVTELDIDVLPPAFDYMGADVSASAEMREELNPYPDALPDSVQQQLTDRYRDIFEIYLRHSDDITRVTFWGVTDGDSWKNNWPVSGRTNYPLIFDRNWEPKPAYHAIIELAEEHR